MFVWCSECDYEGPKIDFVIPSSETDEKAFNAWNEESRRTIMRDKNGAILTEGTAIWYHPTEGWYANQKIRALVVGPNTIKLVDAPRGPNRSITLPRVNDPKEADMEIATDGDKMLYKLEQESANIEPIE